MSAVITATIAVSSPSLSSPELAHIITPGPAQPDGATRSRRPRNPFPVGARFPRARRQTCPPTGRSLQPLPPRLRSSQSAPASRVVPRRTSWRTWRTSNWDVPLRCVGRTRSARVFHDARHDAGRSVRPVQPGRFAGRAQPVPCNLIGSPVPCSLVGSPVPCGLVGSRCSAMQAERRGSGSTDEGRSNSDRPSSDPEGLLDEVRAAVRYGFGGLLRRAVCFPSSQRPAVGGGCQGPAPIV